ncbi:hypothetical protein SAPIO_CDS8908 [Scedosporium apiospermum]|uniref:Uncharacterized protein n=1 Tax=Pseudallescheria apiosperma TaxID=563466 RepID=A0A084FXX7_PSEDA|nr:uncharacterized protein SAPIO_CDS8908 [Scedosporium apiospermum]KEZ39939.1 hypothetical protein SAPIO_CDS8908 [Scedosporium apiospermum]
MGSTINAIKTLIVPAVISLIIFLTSRFVIVPLWRRYRQRYSQYLPIDTISNHTMTLRQRLQGAYSGMLAPTWRRRFRSRVVVGGDEEVVSDDEYTSEEGEELADVDVESWSSAAHGGSRTDIPSSDRRLSRDLEEGFRSESDDDDNRNENYRR